MLRRLIARCTKAGARLPFARLLLGALCSLCLTTPGIQWLTLLGTSSAVSLALAMALLAGFLGGLGLAAIAPVHRRPLGPPLAALALTAWMVACPWGVDLLDGLLAQADWIHAAAGFQNAVVLALACLVYAGVPAMLIAYIGSSSMSTVTGAGHEGTVLLGAATGILLFAFGLAQLLGPWVCGLAAAVALLVVTCHKLFRSPRDTQAFASPDLPETEVPFSVSLPSAQWVAGAGNGLIAVGVGSLIAAACAIVEQLIPGSAYLLAGELAGVLAGLGIGLLIACRSGRSHVSLESRRLSICLVLAAWASLLVAVFPQLVQGSLLLNAYVSSPTILLAARAALAAIALAPLASAVPLVSGSTASRALNPAISAWMLLTSFAGFWTALALIGEGTDPVTLLAAFAAGVAVVAIIRDARLARLPAGWPARGALALLALVAALAPVWRERCDPRLSAKLLFNTNVFVGFRNGMSMDLLPALDEGRPVAMVRGARGVTTVWRYAGHQLQLRENGMPAGVVSSDPRLFPRYLPETAQVALPLVLHEKPQSLLLLGAGSGESLSAALTFPLPEVTCWETDTARVRLLREVIGPALGSDLLDDDRVRLTVAEPAVALDSESRRFDVVVSSPAHLSLVRAQWAFTRQFYARAARRLEADGIFCQRLQFIDLGPHPMRAIVGTIQSVFAEVIAIETAPGEMVLLATNSSKGLVRKELAARLVLPHVRALLGQSGIDWAVIPNLGAYPQEGLAEFTRPGPRQPNQAANSRLAFSLPREVARWAPKLREVQESLAPHAGRLAMWMGDDGTSPDLVRRLSEVTGQRELMSKYSDQYWAYRTQLRTQLTARPRSPIQQAIRQVSGGDDSQKMHPEDRRRLNYFGALGRAVKTRSLADIRRLEKFETPYDPLMSYFLHLEAAELLSRSPERDPALELQHRLHATWFSSARDASLQNVLGALRILRNDSEAEPDAAARWDTLNALLQALVQRWEARAGIPPRDVKTTLDDCDATVLAVEQTLDAMQPLAAAAGIEPALWSARRTVLDRALVRPVKAYRSELLPQLHRKKKPAGSETEAAPDVAAESREPAAPATTAE